MEKIPSQYGCRLCNFGMNVPGNEWCPHCGFNYCDDMTEFDRAIGLMACDEMTDNVINRAIETGEGREDERLV